MLQAVSDVIAIEYCRKTNVILPATTEHHPIREFYFLDGRQTEDYEKWVKWVNDDGIRKMILYPNLPKIIERRKELGFLRAFIVIMPVFHANGEMTFWQNRWDYLKEENRWKIVSREQAWENGPKELIAFPGKPEIQAMVQPLQAAMQLCDQIGEPGWKRVFENSIAMLQQEDYDFRGAKAQKYFERYLGILPEQNLRLLSAAANAFVFGAMGTWNDGPAGKAAEAGLEKEYNQISDMLAAGCIMNLTYAVNRW